MKTLIILSAIFLTGCANTCTSHCVGGFGPGNGLYQAMANHYDGMDPCQKQDKPNFCGASKNKTYYINKGVGNTVVVRQQ